MERIGLVGLPNSGKSSLFNALTGGSALVAAHAFSTTETSVGVAQVPDARLVALAAMSSSRKVVHASVEFVDIAGLVAGSSTGEGLGNRFLGGIREADALCLVLRAFEDPNVPGGSDPLDDLGVLELELVLADLATVESQLERRRKAARADRSLEGQVGALEVAHAALAKGTPIYRAHLDAEQLEHLRPFFMLTNKPVLAVVNLGEDAAGDDAAFTKPVADELGRGRGPGRQRQAGGGGGAAGGSRQGGAARGLGPGRGRPPAGGSGGLPFARPAHLPHHGGQGEPGVDFPGRGQGPRMRGRDPFRPPARASYGPRSCIGTSCWPWGLGRRPGMPANCGSRARSTRSSMAMSSRSASTSEPGSSTSEPGSSTSRRPAGLVVVATPIGNLGDLSPRAVEALASAGFIYCEDTRRALKLLSHASIKGPRWSPTIVSTRRPARRWRSSACRAAPPSPWLPMPGRRW